MSDLSVKGVGQTQSITTSGDNVNAALVSRSRSNDIVQGQPPKIENPLLKQTPEKIESDHSQLKSGTLNTSKISSDILAVFSDIDTIQTRPRSNAIVEPSTRERSNAIVERPEIHIESQKEHSIQPPLPHILKDIPFKPQETETISGPPIPPPLPPSGPLKPSTAYVPKKVDSKTKNEEYAARLEKQVGELNTRKSELSLKVDILTRGLSNFEKGSKDFSKQAYEIHSLKQQIKVIDEKLSKIPNFKKAGITSESIKGYQASKQGENLYQKVMGTKVYERDDKGDLKVSTMLNSDDLGILPAIKPKLKGLMEKEPVHGAEHDAHEKFGWTNVKDQKVSSPSEMIDLISYRKAFVDQLMKQVKEEFQVEGSMRSVGSTNLTSDYDATILGLTSTKKGEEGQKVSPVVQAQIVAKFNEEFRKEFGVEAGTAFDTNIYVDDFDLSPANLKNQKLDPEIQLKDDKNQDSLALVKQRIHMSDSDWNSYVDTVVNSLPPEKREAVRTQYKNANDYAIRRELEINTKIVSINDDKKGIKRDLLSLSPSQLKSEAEYIKHLAGDKGDDVEAQALNRLYEEKLVDVKVAEDSGSKLEVGSKERQESDVNVKKLKGEALFFANEPYFSEGGVRHIVGNLQKLSKEPLDKKFEITKSQGVQSISENIGDTMKEFNHFSKDGLGTLSYKASKYINRLADAITATVGQPQGVGTDKKMVVPDGINIKIDGKDYALKDIISDMRKSNAALLEIRGETVGKDWSPQKKGEEALKMLEANTTLEPFKALKTPDDYKKLLLDITSQVNILVRQD